MILGSFFFLFNKKFFLMAEQIIVLDDSSDDEVEFIDNGKYYLLNSIVNTISFETSLRFKLCFNVFTNYFNILICVVLYRSTSTMSLFISGFFVFRLNRHLDQKYCAKEVGYCCD